MARKKTFQTFKEAAKVSPYAERPLLPDTLDIQLHLSRNNQTQPFHLICEKDTLFVLASGKGRVEFRDTSVSYYSLVPGDYIYVPAGVPHKIDPETESVVMRYKPRPAGLEGIAWYCDSCGTELYREVFDTAAEIPQAAYVRITTHFNENQSLRTCATCESEHAAIDLSPFGWNEIAAEIEADQAAM